MQFAGRIYETLMQTINIPVQYLYSSGMNITKMTHHHYIPTKSVPWRKQKPKNREHYLQNHKKDLKLKIGLW